MGKPVVLQWFQLFLQMTEDVRIEQEDELNTKFQRLMRYAEACVNRKNTVEVQLGLLGPRFSDAGIRTYKTVQASEVI